MRAPLCAVCSSHKKVERITFPLDGLDLSDWCVREPVRTPPPPVPASTDIQIQPAAEPVAVWEAADGAAAAGAPAGTHYEEGEAGGEANNAPAAAASPEAAVASPEAAEAAPATASGDAADASSGEAVIISDGAPWKSRCSLTWTPLQDSTRQ